MNNYRVEIGSLVLGNEEIMSISGVNSTSAIGEELSIDETQPTIIYAFCEAQSFAPKGYDVVKTTDDKYFCTNKTFVDIEAFSRGTPVRIYVGNTLWRKTYLKKIKKVANAYIGKNRKYQYEIQTMSAIGLMDTVKHFGGMYQGTYGAIMRDIFGKAGFTENTDYVIDSDVSQTEAGSVSSSIYCYLPISTCRENLKMCLNACGASIIKQADGKIRVLYNVPTTTKTISNGNTYNDGNYDYSDKATRAVVIEHHFITGGQSTTLYSNTEVSVTNKVVTFNQPMYNLQWNGSAFSGEHSCNHAVLNGTGVLTGNEYIHTTTEIVKDNLNDGDEKEVSITDNTLVTALNSLNVLERLASYYGDAQIIKASYVVTDESPMDKVKIVDKFGDEVEGYIKDMDMTASSNIKSTSEIITNWQPNHLGNSFSHSVLIKSSDLVGGVYNVATKCPQAVGKAGMVVLFSGMGGGQGGYNGESSPYGATYEQGANGGQGGQGGQAGQRGRFVTGVIFSIASSYNVSFGQGGAGGSANGGAGGQGGDSTFGSYTTQGASQLTAPYTDFVSGNVYGQLGANGYRGGNGGHSLKWRIDFPHEEQVEDWWWGQIFGGEYGGYGESLTYNGVTYQGGSPMRYMLAYPIDGNTANYQMLNAPSGGGGCAYGSNGGNAGHGTMSMMGANQWAGQGANASAPSNAQLGFTGHGGNGGGGAGAGGWTSQSHSASYTVPCDWSGTMQLKGGGSGSIGGRGSDGFAILYYGEE